MTWNTNPSYSFDIPNSFYLLLESSDDPEQTSYFHEYWSTSEPHLSSSSSPLWASGSENDSDSCRVLAMSSDTPAPASDCLYCLRAPTRSPSSNRQWSAIIQELSSSFECENYWFNRSKSERGESCPSVSDACYVLYVSSQFYDWLIQ